MRKNRQKGFTLIELLVVIGIMATMAAIVIPNVAKFLAPAQATADDDEFGNVQAAMDMYIAENNLPCRATAKGPSARRWDLSVPV